ncbi:hypothetical protein ACLB2K_007067 [Fragaria x ananassa]
MELEAEVKSLRLSLEKCSPLEGKFREKEFEIAELECLAPVRCNQAVAVYKESRELKDFLQSARDAAIMEKFKKWSEHGYLDKPRMLADLLATKAKAEAQDSQAIHTEGPLEANPDNAGVDVNASESEDEDDLVNSVEKDQA